MMTPCSTIVLSDAFDFLDSLPSSSVDAIITDPPYGSTSLAWDKLPDLSRMWAAFDRVVKPNAPIVLFAMQPFSSLLVASNLSGYRCEWVWCKNRPTGAVNAKRHPLRAHEQILVFGRGQVEYRPQMWESGIKKSVPAGGVFSTYSRTARIGYRSDGERYPTTVLHFPMSHAERGLHPTQKPVALMEYLISTYSAPGAVVVDPFAGSGSTLVAARNTGRLGLGCDNNEAYVRVAQSRLDAAYNLRLFAEVV